MIQFRLEYEYIELYKLLKLLDLVDSGGEAKMLISEGYISRNGDKELRKRAKIIKGDVLLVGDDVKIEVL